MKILTNEEKFAIKLFIGHLNSIKPNWSTEQMLNELFQLKEEDQDYDPENLYHNPGVG